jgi:hypothetical protein
LVSFFGANNEIKKALINKEIIDQTNGAYAFLDPVFKLWFL